MMSGKNQILRQIVIQLCYELYEIRLKKHQIHRRRTELNAQIMEEESSDAIRAKKTGREVGQLLSPFFVSLHSNWIKI